MSHWYIYSLTEVAGCVFTLLNEKIASMSISLTLANHIRTFNLTFSVIFQRKHLDLFALQTRYSSISVCKGFYS